MNNCLTRWVHAGIAGISLMGGVCGLVADARATCHVEYINCPPCAGEAGNFSATPGSLLTFKAKADGCAISDVTWTVTKLPSGNDAGWTKPYAYHKIQLSFSSTFPDLGAYAIHVRFDPEGAEKEVALQIQPSAFTVNIIPSAGCAVIAGDGGVDAVETDGIACAGGMAATDPLCTEQFKNTAIAALKVTTEPGFVFTGWIVDGAHIEIASAAPLFLTTMPLLASNGPVMNCPQNTTEQTSCQRIQINVDSNNDGSIDAQDDPVEETSGNMIDYQDTTARIPVELIAEGVELLDDTFSLEVAASSGGSHLLAWESETATAPLTLPKSYALDALPSTLYVSGCKTSDCGPGEAKLELRLLQQQDGKTKIRLSDSISLLILDALTIDGDFRVFSSAKIPAPYYGMAGLFEQEENDVRFFRTLAGMRVHVQAITLPGVTVTNYRWSGAPWPASPQGRFFNGYGLNTAELTGNALTGSDLKEIYWDMPEQTDSEAEVFLTATITQGAGSLEVTRSRRFRTRTLKRTLPTTMTGDDVTMLQTLLNFFNWKDTSQLVIDGSFGPGTEKRMISFKQQNRGTWLDQNADVGENEIGFLRTHFDDYRTALFAFGWNDGSPTQNNAKMNDSYADFMKASELDSNGWVDNWAASLNALESGIISPETSWSTDKRRLLLKLIEVESRYRHWTDWTLNTSYVGALGFVQIMPNASSRYNDDSGATYSVGNSLNMYHPAENIQAGVQLINNYCLTPAFSGTWTRAGENNVALLKKALACYNGGRRGTLANHSWQEISANPANFSMSRQVNYVSEFFECPGSLLGCP